MVGVVGVVGVVRQFLRACHGVSECRARRRGCTHLGGSWKLAHLVVVEDDQAAHAAERLRQRVDGRVAAEVLDLLLDLALAKDCVGSGHWSDIPRIRGFARRRRRRARTHRAFASSSSCPRAPRARAARGPSLRVAG